MFESLETYGERTCLIVEGSTHLSYRELVRLSNAFADQLGKKRHLVLLEVNNTVACVAAIVACFRGNQPFILCSDTTRSRIEASFHPDVLVDPSGRITWAANPGSHGLHPDLAIMLSTSGSTGATKLVRLSASAMVSNAAAIVEYLNLDANERTITSLPISYSYGLSILTSHLSVGASIVLTEKSVVDDSFWDLFANLQVTSLAGVPYTYELLETIGFRDRAHPSLHYMTQAGGRLAPDLVRRYANWSRDRGVRFYTMYGQTEAAPRMAYLPPELALSHADCIGRAVPGGTLRVVDTVGRPAMRGTIGELVYTGPNVMMGYALEPEDLARGSELAELHTGDLAQEVENGVFKIMGRSSRFSKIAGLRIDLDDLERFLHDRGHEAVAAGDDALVAIGIKGGDGSVTMASRMVDERLPLSKQSCIVFDLPETPRLSSGKIDYRDVLAKGIEMRAARAASRTARFKGKDSIAREFAQVLHHDGMDGRESFASLGGDSLSYVELSVAIERRLRYLPAGWEHLTIDQIDALLSKLHRPMAAPAPHVGTEIALRAAAIVFIVAHHSLMMDLGGGMEALLLLVGLNLARTQPWRLASSSQWKFFKDVGMRLLLPYYLILVGFALRHHDHISWLLWFLLGNWLPLHSSFSIYWFISAYVQVLLIIFALASIAPIRRLMTETSGHFAVMFLLAALALKIAVFAAFQHVALHGRTPDQFIYIVALGWCLQAAKTITARLSLVAVAAGIMAIDLSGIASTVWSGFDGHWRNESLLASVIVLTFVKSIRVPQVVCRLLTYLAVASLTIYLTHPLLLALTADWFSPPQKYNPYCYVAVACFLAFGVMFHRLAGLLRHRTLRFEKLFKGYVRTRRSAVV